MATVPAPAPQATPSPSNGGLRASPRARRLARDRGVDLAALTGSGRNGRISGDDVLADGGHQGCAPAASAIQVATIAGTIQVREWPAIGQRRGDAFLIHGLFADGGVPHAARAAPRQGRIARPRNRSPRAWRQ